ncbi:hypothetical protein ACLB1T_15170 [Escherichia coli]
MPDADRRPDKALAPHPVVRAADATLTASYHAYWEHALHRGNHDDVNTRRSSAPKD